MKAVGGLVAPMLVVAEQPRPTVDQRSALAVSLAGGRTPRRCCLRPSGAYGVAVVMSTEPAVSDPDVAFKVIFPAVVLD
jgi:hypothetical protein